MEAKTGTVQLDGLEMDYAVFGRGRKNFIILPGMSVKSVMESANVVANQYSPFCEEYTVFVFDRRKNLEEGCSVLEMADDSFRAMEALGISEADIFGASQGGMIALALAALHPQKVHRLALASTQARPNRFSTATMAEWERLSRAGLRRELNRDIFGKVYSPGFHKRYERAFGQLEDNGTPEELRRFAILAGATTGFDIFGNLYLVSCPVYAAGPEDDTVLSSAGIREIASVLDCELHIYPGKGHAVYDEDKDFPNKILEFFKR